MNISSTTLWLVIIAVGVGTFAFRSSFILLVKKVGGQPWIDRALRQVPPAVMAALLTSGVLIRDGAVDLSLDNTKLIATALAALVAWFSKSLLWTILSGMIFLWILP